MRDWLCSLHFGKSLISPVAIAGNEAEAGGQMHGVPEPGGDPSEPGDSEEAI